MHANNRVRCYCNHACMLTNSPFTSAAELMLCRDAQAQIDQFTASPAPDSRRLAAHVTTRRTALGTPSSEQMHRAAQSQHREPVGFGGQQQRRHYACTMQARAINTRRKMPACIVRRGGVKVCVVYHCMYGCLISYLASGGRGCPVVPTRHAFQNSCASGGASL